MNHSEEGKDSIPTLLAVFIFESWNSFVVRAVIITSKTFVFFRWRYFFSVWIGRVVPVETWLLPHLRQNSSPENVSAFRGPRLGLLTKPSSSLNIPFRAGVPSGSGWPRFLHTIGPPFLIFCIKLFLKCTFTSSCYSTRLSKARTPVINWAVCLGQKVSSQ